MEARKIQFSLLILVQFTKFSYSNDIITINQTLKEGDFLISKENNFELGFFRPGNSNHRYLGIWFYKVSLKTVIWVANRNNPINGNSSGFLSINQRGHLALYSEIKEIPVWSSNISEEVIKDSTNLSAQLLDDGNFILFEATSRRILWQSFEHPTDTLIPGMKIGLNRISGKNLFLASWRSSNDPGIGEYSFKLNPSGSPQFYVYKGTKLYWRTGPWPWILRNLSFGAIFEQKEDEIYTALFNLDPSIITRLVLQDSGTIEWLIWNNKHNQWKDLMSAPKDKCDQYGECGANSKCDPNLIVEFECNCLPGYEPKSPKDWQLRDGSNGCIRKRLNHSSLCGNGEGFVKLVGVKIPDTAAAVWVDTSSVRMECERKCKDDCSCSAYSSIPISGKGTGCLHWYGDLIDIGYYVIDTGYDLYVRVDAVELAKSASATGPSSGFRKKGMLSVVLVSASAWFVLIMISIYFCCRMMKKKRTMKSQRKKRLLDSMSGSNFYEDTLDLPNDLEGGNRRHPDLVFFNVDTIITATDNFSPLNRIGEGGFGTVYKGQLSNGKEIAIKQLSKNSMQGIEEFKNEAMLMAKLQHRNLVKLLGCCIQREEPMLIYEYMPNKSLDSILFYQTRESLLDWGKRFNIIVGIARGILYLHQDSRLRIIHRDLKCSYVLLDAEMNPKISDFGMARIFKSDQFQEYAVFGKFSEKFDVFSFGIILLEIISGKRNNGFSQEDPSPGLIGNVWELWNEDRALEMIDSLLMESYDPHEALRCIQVGLLCVQEDAVDRPTMLDVVLMLKSEAALPSPNQPAFVYRTTSSNTNSPDGEEGPYSVNEMTITDILTR